MNLVGVDGCLQLNTAQMVQLNDTRFNQQQKDTPRVNRVDYSYAFFLVAKIDNIWVIYSIAANKDSPRISLTLKTSFSIKIKEKVYIEGLPRFTHGFTDGEERRPKRALYGLRQSPRAWFGKFTICNEEIWVSLE